MTPERKGLTMSKMMNRLAPEVCEQAVHLMLDHEGDHPSPGWIVRQRPVQTMTAFSDPYSSVSARSGIFPRA